MAELKRLSVAAARKANELDVDLGDGTSILCQRVDMSLLLFEGQIPMPMLLAAQRMIAMPTGATPMDRMEALEGEGATMVSVLRRHAVMVAIDPRISLDPKDVDAIPATYLKLPALMSIWNATALTPKVGPEKATRFRRRQRADVAPVAPAGDDLPPPAEHVDPPAVEYHGR